ncbi:MAG TPA: serine/threonine-protein kinase [Solirubrobacteraceae bacterium]|nr:serine/threonine-protein kinase [Solirubrobacteraceae bacterium]
MSAPVVLSPGAKLGGYRIVDVLGIGGMAIVYRAEQLSLGRWVALKVLAPRLGDDLLFRERFRREGLHAAELEHPHIVPVYDSGEADGRLFLAMRLVDGQTLAEHIHDPGLSGDEAVALLSPIASALDCAHANGLIHRDVKPQNILINRKGHPYLADFGVAKGAHTPGLTTAGGFVGTVAYASPEQIRGERPTPASDTYALTAVLYQCLTGNVPYVRDTEAGMMLAHLNEPPPALPTTDLRDAALADVIARGMAKHAADRYASAGALLHEASACLHSTPARRHMAPAFGNAAATADGLRDGPAHKPGDRPGDEPADRPAHRPGDEPADRRTPSVSPPARDGKQIEQPAARGARPDRSKLIIGAVIAIVIATGSALTLLLGGASGGSPSKRARVTHAGTPSSATSSSDPALGRALTSAFSRRRRSWREAGSLAAHTLRARVVPASTRAAADSAAATTLAGAPSDAPDRKLVAGLVSALHLEGRALQSLADAAGQDHRAAYAGARREALSANARIRQALATLHAHGIAAPSSASIELAVAGLPRRPKHSLAHTPSPVQAGLTSSQSVSPRPATPAPTRRVAPAQRAAPVTHHHAPSHYGPPTVIAPTG